MLEEYSECVGADDDLSMEGDALRIFDDMQKGRVVSAAARWLQHMQAVDPGSDEMRLSRACTG